MHCEGSGNIEQVEMVSHRGVEAAISVLLDTFLSC